MFMLLLLRFVCANTFNICLGKYDTIEKYMCWTQSAFEGRDDKVI